MPPKKRIHPKKVCAGIDGFGFIRRGGDIVRGAFIIHTHEREIFAWWAMVNALISGSDSPAKLPQRPKQAISPR